MTDATVRSQTAFEAARAVLPGGVNSPARACRSVGVDPIFAASGDGCWITDVDGNRYRDYVCAFGPLVLGHNHPRVVAAITDQLSRGLAYGLPTEAETEIGEAIRGALPGMELLRFVSSGTEATMSALRVARGFTGRAKVVKLAGNYHGHADFLLVKAGSGAMTLGAPDSAGVTAGAAADTLLAPHNDLAALQALFAAHPGEIAAVILEPVAGNMGVVPPQAGWLEGVRELTRADGALLVFDEVMTGFRVAWGGAQRRYGVTPDMTCLGKIVGGGLPVGAYGGRADVMGAVSPLGPVYQAGTNSGNPVAVAAGLATLRVLSEAGTYEGLEALGARLQAGLEAALTDTRTAGVVQRVGSMITCFFTDGPVTCVDDVSSQAVARFAAFFRGMRERGVMLPPSQYEAWFISTAHTSEDIDATIAAAHAVMQTL